MTERLGCDIEHVWLTAMLLGSPLLLTPMVPESLRWICVLFALLIGLLILAPYSVLVTKGGVSLIAIRATIFIKWDDIVRVKYNGILKIVIIKAGRTVALMPFGIWAYSRSHSDYRAFLDLLNSRLDDKRVIGSSLF
ncbi:MAG: hypothetical protein K8F91_11565 [Candidatus Obscuribacterales bacterium]|nr:hypothetical protein [Candidatus Obscuribacterales bacterium]